MPAEQNVKHTRGHALVLLILISLLLTGCSDLVSQGSTYAIPGADANRGRQAMTVYGCIACHTIPGVTRADATVGPPLTGWAKRATIAGEFPNRPENLIAWLQDPQKMIPGSVMPDMGVPEATARDMSAYLYTLQQNPARFPWVK
jgi:cytochrome c2